MNMTMKRKAQQEIVGFIMIVVIVVIIGLFLLVFYLRKEPVKQESLDLENFLQASMLYTTDCAVNFVPQYKSVQELIASCYNNEKCLNEEMACDVLNSSFSRMVKESFSGKESSSYSLVIYYENEGAKEKILESKEGNCTGSKTGAEHLIPRSPGNLIVDIETCYV